MMLTLVSRHQGYSVMYEWKQRSHTSRAQELELRVSFQLWPCQARVPNGVSVITPQQQYFFKILLA